MTRNADDGDNQCSNNNSNSSTRNDSKEIRKNIYVDDKGELHQ